MKKQQRTKEDMTLYNYHFDHGRVYRFKNDKYVKPRYIKLDVDQTKKPTAADLMACMEMLMDFHVIRPPKSGTEIHEIIPKFETIGELISWRSKMINNGVKTW